MRQAWVGWSGGRRRLAAQAWDLPHGGEEAGDMACCYSYVWRTSLSLPVQWADRQDRVATLHTILKPAYNLSSIAA